MKYTSTVTQKGQITLPKSLREAVGIGISEKVVLKKERNYIKVYPTVDILDLAGTFTNKVDPKRRNALKAREFMEKNYERV